MTDSLTFLQDNRDRHLALLNDFLRIKSVSTDSSFKDEMTKAVHFLVDYLKEMGFTEIEVQETDKHPLVYAHYHVSDELPTALIYGHYDVQPADPYELWDSAPFEPEVRDGRLYARGASDDKGQVFMHLVALEALMKTNGTLPLNVKVCIEGEEEIGSENLYTVLNEKKAQFDADFCVISDSGMVEENQPTVLYGLKGFTGLEFTVKGPNRDLHSGLYGGAVRNPLMAMSHILSSMKDGNEVVTVEGFYDDVQPLTEEERALMAEAPKEDYIKSLNIQDTVSEQGYTATEHTMARPTLEINGLFGGYQGEGTKTIIPEKATAKLTCRLVPGQDPIAIQDKLVKHIEAHIPTGVTVDITREPLSAKAYKVDFNHPLIKQAAKSYGDAFNKEAVFVRMGGSIPVVEWIDDIFDIPVILLGFGTPDDRLHSPNESFPVENFDRGLVTLVDFYQQVPKVK